MRRVTLVALATLSLLAGAPNLARAAATPPQTSTNASSSIWSVDGASVRVRVMVPAAAARKLTAGNAPPPGLATVASAVSQAFAVTTPAGDCEAVDQGEGVGQIYTLALTPGLYRFEILFACPQAEGLTLKDGLLFDRDPDHIDYAQIRIGGGRPALQTFTSDRQAIPLPASSGQLRNADPLLIARQAAIGLTSRLAAVGIVLGSVLLCRRWLDLVWFAAALSVGYIASIALAFTELMTLDRGLAQAMAGLLVAVLGLGAVQTTSDDTAIGPRWRWATRVGLGGALIGLVVAAAWKSPAAGLGTAGMAVFGLGAVWISRSRAGLAASVFAPAAVFAFMDGLGPASDLTMLRPSPDQLIPILAGHDIGGWLGAIAIAGCAMGLIWLAGRRLGAWRRAGSEWGGAALIGLGLFWFVSRLYS